MARKRSKDPLISLEFGNALKDAREKRGLSLEELARRIDKTDAILSRYESGQRFPPKTTLEALERELKTDLSGVWLKAQKEWKEYLKQREKRHGFVELELPLSVERTIRGLAKTTGKPPGYIVKELLVRGISAYHRDKLLREPKKGVEAA